MVYFGGRWRKPEPHEARIYGGRRTFVYNGGRWAGRTLNPLVPGSSPGRPPTERNGVSRSPKSTGSTRSKSLVDPKTFGKGLTHVDPGDPGRLGRLFVDRRAGVAELEDAQGLGPCGVTRGGSTPSARTSQTKLRDQGPGTRDQDNAAASYWSPVPGPVVNVKRGEQ